MLSVFRYCLIYLKMTAGDQRLARAELFIMQILVWCAVVCIVYVVGLGVLCALRFHGCELAWTLGISSLPGLC